MSYFRKKTDMRNITMVKEYYNDRAYPKGEKRDVKRVVTTEETRRNNQRVKAEKATELVFNNFTVGDVDLILTFSPDNEPNSEAECKKIFSKFIRKLRRIYESHGYKLLWIRNIEKGDNGGWHIHFLVNVIPNDTIDFNKIWGLGNVHIKRVADLEGLKRLSEYISKPSFDCGRQIHGYSHSRNLVRPIPGKPQKMKRDSFPDEIPVPRGYYSPKMFVVNGVNTRGRKYRTYILIKLDIDWDEEMRFYSLRRKKPLKEKGRKH